METTRNGLDSLFAAKRFLFFSSILFIIISDLAISQSKVRVLDIIEQRLYRTPTAKDIAYYQADYAWTALHETLHLGKRGWYSDQQLAEAAYSFAGLAKPIWNGKGDKVSYFSNLLDQELKKHCPQPQQ